MRSRWQLLLLVATVLLCTGMAQTQPGHNLLRDTSLSADLLEERARSLLGFADPRDYVIRMKP